MEDTRRIRITESQIKEMIKESVERILEETQPKKIRIEDYFDLEELSKREDFAWLNSDMRVFIPMVYCGQLFQVPGEPLVLEYEVRTLPVEELREKLRNLGFKDWQVQTHEAANKVTIAVLYADIELNADTIVKEMQAYGWYKSTISDPHDINGIPYRVMTFDPAEQQCLNGEAFRFRWLYHISHVSNMPSIMTNGLIPKSQNSTFDYPPRVHVVRGDTSDLTLAELGFDLFKANKNVTNGHYLVFQILTDKLPNTIKFYGDPRCYVGYYTMQTIPADALSLYGEVMYSNRKQYQEERIQQLPKNQ